MLPSPRKHPYTCCILLVLCLFLGPLTAQGMLSTAWEPYPFIQLPGGGWLLQVENNRFARLIREFGGIDQVTKKPIILDKEKFFHPVPNWHIVPLLRRGLGIKNMGGVVAVPHWEQARVRRVIPWIENFPWFSFKGFKPASYRATKLWYKQKLHQQGAIASSFTVKVWIKTYDFSTLKLIESKLVSTETYELD